ncbi:hypothetical protein ABE10_25380 [Bacillus toyonensis]|nr:hypothetical protein [Bacillus toyonensis]MBG9889829.1 hypothetical protein [Bacillus toyonensis]
MFDDEWLTREAGIPLLGRERERVEYALANGGAEPPDGETASKAQVREYWRIKRARQLRAVHSAQEPRLRALAEVRGRGYNEWREHVTHLKRTGHLETALALSYECSDAAERHAAAAGFGPSDWWAKQTAIILRKLDDYEAEIRFIEELVERVPSLGALAERLPASRRFLARQQREHE